MGLINAYRDAVYKKLLQGADFVTPSGHFIALFTTPMSDNGTGGQEVTGGSYSRVSLEMGDPTAGVGTNTNTLEWIPAENWGLIKDIVLFDSFSGGNPIWRNVLLNPIPLNLGNKLTFPPGSLTFKEGST